VVDVRSVQALLLLLVIVPLVSIPFVCADKGGFPLAQTQERVSETAQKTIIAWNGTHEILVLSTDVSSSIDTEVLEIMPLPSNPTISKGDKQSFLKVQNLVNTYFENFQSGRLVDRTKGQGSMEQTHPEVTITFQEIIGVHDLTVVNVDEAHELISWLEDFLGTKGYVKQTPSGLESLLSYYLSNGMSFFAIDIVRTNATVRTIDPLVYKFTCPKLYYPLRISTLFSGITAISLFTITSSELNADSLAKEHFERRAQFQITQESLSEIDTNMTDLFSGNPFLSYFLFNGYLSSFKEDILADFQTGFDLAPVMVAMLSAGSILALLSPFFSLKETGRFRLKSTGHVTARRLEMALLLVGLSGVLLTFFGLMLPWGLTGFGEKREVLAPLGGFSQVSIPIKNDVIRGLSVIFPFDVFIMAAIICYTYLLLVNRISKMASGLLLVVGFGILLQTALWICGICVLPSTYYAYYPTYMLDTGVLTTIVGGLFIMLAGSFSFWRTRLMPQYPALGTRMEGFKSFAIKRLLISFVTLLGVFILIFIIWNSLPIGYRLGSWGW
jgi:hypothetical protein